MTSLTVFFDIALESAKPALVRKSALVKINSQARVIESLSHILGPLRLCQKIYEKVMLKTEFSF